MVDSILPKDIVAEAIGSMTSRQDASNITSTVLQSQAALDNLAVSEQRANRLTEDPGLGKDLLEMSYGELVFNYGPEVANNRYRLRETMRNHDQIRGAERSIPKRLGDAALGAGASFVSLSGNTFGLAAGYTLGGLTDAGSRAGAVATANLTSDISQKIRSLRSNEAQEQERLVNIEAGLDVMDSAEQMSEEIDNGRNIAEAAFARVGRDILNTGGRILSSQAAIDDILASSVGSLGPSAALARITGKVATGVAAKATANKVAQRVAHTVGVATGVGASEAGGTYSDTVSEVMSMSKDALAASPVYTALLKEGYSPEAAQTELAAITAESAFVRQLPTAAALGLIAGKFEEAPIGVFKGAGVAKGLRTIISQGVEEAAQGGSSAYNQNIAIQANVDKNRSLTEGVGTNIAEGVIGGLGQAGLAASPTTVIGTAKRSTTLASTVAKGVQKAVTTPQFNDPLTQSIQGVSPIGEIVSATGDVLSTGTKNTIETTSTIGANLTNRLVSEPKEYNDPLRNDILNGRQRVKGAIRLLASPLVDRATSNDREAINQATEIAQETVNAFEDAIDQNEFSPEISEILTSPDTSPATPTFTEVKTENESFMGKVARITGKLADRRMKISDSDAAYAGSQFARLKNIVPSLPNSVKAKALKLLESPQVKRVNERLAKMDQNIAPIPEKITPSVVSETLALAKTKPTAVNPNTAKKILEQSGEILSSEDIKILEGASKIASIINTRQGNEVTISNDRNIALQKKTGKPVVKSNSINETSRSLRVQGYTKADGKTPLRSLNDFASDIMQAIQSPNGTILNDEGIPVSADLIMGQLGNLVRHMNNKVNALNESFSKNNRRGSGPSTTFEGLVGSDKFIPASKYKHPVAYHRNNPNSAFFAKQVAADQQATIDVYNTLREMFPDKFKTLPEATAVELLQDEGGYKDLSELNTEIDSQETQPDPVLDEEVPPQVESSKEQNQEPKQNEEVQNKTTQDSEIIANQSNNKIVDEKGNPIKFFHGTNTDFTKFKEGKIFLTTRKGLAREHALRGKEGTPRLIEAEVSLANPLNKQIPNKEDTDTFWLKNSLSLETEKENGGYDSIFLFNDKEAIVIADQNDQIEITNSDFDSTQEQLDENLDLNNLSGETDNTFEVHESFYLAYSEKDSNSAPKNLDDYLERVENSDSMNQNTVAFAKKLIRPMISALNKRLQLIKVNGKPLLDQLKEDTVQTYKQYRNTVIVDKNIGKYDQNLIELASIAFIDWMVSVRSRDPNQLEDTLQELGISIADITEEQMEGVLFGVSVNQAKATIAKDILRMWGMKENLDAPLSYLVGITEGLAAEMITVIANNPNLSLLEIQDLPLGMKEGKPQITQTIIVKGLTHVQDQINDVQKENTNKLAREELFEIAREEFSVGSKIKETPINQTRGSIRLSSLERKAIKKMQDTPHFKNEANEEFIRVMGDKALMRMLGYVENTEHIQNNTYKRSIEGKNLSILMNIKNMYRVLDSLKNEETPVYYPVGVSKTGRHPMQGPNPQSNKLLRALVTPTWSTLNFNSKKDMDLFWITVAQAADLMKVEKIAHTDVLSNIKDIFNKKYRTAVDIAKEFLETGKYDGEAFVNAIGTNIEPQIMAAVLAVAQMEMHQKAGASEFRTSLSFEIDGLTNGAANMMVNFGQGEITKSDFHNFNRVGFFLGQIGKTLNQYFSTRGSKGERNLDLYEKTSGQSQAAMYRNLNNMSLEQQEITLAAGRFAARFGNFEIDEKTGQPLMTRNTAKNPMTKVNYGSSVGGVGIGLADDMLIKFYEKIQGIPQNVNLDTYFAYPDMQKDIRILFGDTLPSNLQQGAFEFPKYAITEFQKNVSATLGQILTNTTKSVIGDKITEVNNMLVFSTNIQAEYVQLIFHKRLEELAERRATEGKIRRHPKTRKPIITELSRRDYNSVVRELEALSPIFVSDDQTLAVGGFQTKKSDFELSSAMNGKLNQKSSLPMPEDVGVAAIPYVVIGTGDAMMMNFIFGSDGAPTDVLGIYDGLDIPISKISEYGPYVNQQVMKTWERDVLGMVTNNFNNFIAKANDTVLKTAFQNVRDKVKTTTITAKSAQDLATQLNKRHQQNAARKAVFKRISVSVDQMGGTDNGFIRGEKEMSLIEINREINKELNKKEKLIQNEINIEIQKSTATAVLRNLRTNSNQKKVVEILKPLLKNTKVIFGSLDDMNQYRLDNFGDDGLILKAKANYDAVNNVIFMATTKSEPILHEMVHAATFGRVHDHYIGTQHNEAVTRLEALMEEFLALNVDGPHIRETKSAILRHKAANDADSKAAALNEFMAYALTNREVSKVLSNNNTKTLVNIGKKVIQLMRRLMGGIPETMFDNVVFNTQILNDTPIEDIADDNGAGGGGNETSSLDGSDNGREFTNFWIKTITDYISETFNKNREGRRSVQPIINLSQDADGVLDSFRQAGLVPSREQQATFRAIYMVIRSQIKLNPVSVIGLTNIFKHIDDNMTPDMFGNGSEAPHIYSAVRSAMGKKDAIAILLALSQTSSRFREVLGQIPNPQGEVQIDGSLGSFFSKMSQMLMSKIIGSTTLGGKEVQTIMEELASGIVAEDVKREYTALHTITGSLTKADNYLSRKMSQLSNKVSSKNQEIQRDSRSKFTRILANTVTLGTNLLDSTNAEVTGEIAKRATHMNVPFLSLVPIRELISEIIGTDRFNTNLVALQSVVNNKISGMRQSYREDLPVILQNLFTRPPEANEWASLHTVLGQTDLTRFIKPTANGVQRGFQLLEERARRQARITELEQILEANFLPNTTQDAKDKAQQLANYMNGHGAGKLLMRNAYAIVKNLDGHFQESMVQIVDELITMYVIDQINSEVRETTVRLWQEDPKAVTGMVTYLQGLNEEEDSKLGISEQARLNGYKGYIPNYGDKDTRIIIDLDSNKPRLEKLGYTKLKAYTGDLDSEFSYSYYVTTTRQGGAYSQGIMQNVQATYRGVDINTGLTVTGETSGFISNHDNQVNRLVNKFNRPDYIQENDKETVMPVFDEDGAILGFEQAINPDILAIHLNPDQNLAVMLAAWAGRHVEEGLAAEYNRTLLDELHKIYIDREPGTDDMFVNLKKTKDPIYKESFSLWPSSAKLYADSLFDNNGPMVRKDQINLSTGYREFSIADFWSGKTRLPKDLQKTVRYVSRIVMGKKALKVLSTGEKITQGAVSTAKDNIVIRSLIVPAANTISNVIQLATRGVPYKEIINGHRTKLAEVEEYNKNVTELIELEVKLRLAVNNLNQRRIIQDKIRVIKDLNEKMTIYPLIEAGAYKLLSEGITELDASITKGNFGDIMETLANKLPKQLTGIAHLGLVSKSTKLYKVANKATQYGDFLAKSIYYDHLINTGLTHEEALAKMEEEFVNFTTLPGRVRSGLESFGLTWFMAFKIRIAKIAAQQLRENPVRALAINNLLPDVGSPINDNIGQVILDDRLGYATGFEMLFNAPELNPWVNLLNN